MPTIHPKHVVTIGFENTGTQPYKHRRGIRSRPLTSAGKGNATCRYGCLSSSSERGAWG